MTKTLSKNSIKTSKQKRINAKALQALISGLVHLVDGQLRFASEFGLNTNRVLPQSESIQDLTDEINIWLRSGDEGVQSIRELFTALINHQLALISALDGIALHAVETLEPKRTEKKLKQRLFELLVNTESEISKWQSLKSNERLRYQHIIVPGFVDSYIRMRESLAGEKQ